MRDFTRVIKEEVNKGEVLDIRGSPGPEPDETNVDLRSRVSRSVILIRSFVPTSSFVSRTPCRIVCEVFPGTNIDIIPCGYLSNPLTQRLFSDYNTTYFKEKDCYVIGLGGSKVKFPLSSLIVILK